MARFRAHAVALMYHDVVATGDADSSGFPGRAPARYKVEWTRFERQLDLLAAVGARPTTIHRVGGASAAGRPLLLTFDDGGASADQIGERLSLRGWVGHFFVPTDYIGQPGFVTADEIVALRKAGHVVGTHSCSHTVPMTRLSDRELVREWRVSCDALRQITGSPVTVGSIPGGYSSRAVLRAAATAGITTMFTSEPVGAARWTDECLVLGRYAVLAGTPADTVVALARGDLGPRLRQLASWRLRALAKVALGDFYRTLRLALLERA